MTKDRQAQTASSPAQGSGGILALQTAEHLVGAWSEDLVRAESRANALKQALDEATAGARTHPSLDGPAR